MLEYESGGVKECWFFDPQIEDSQFYRFGENGRYVSVKPDAEGIIRSTTIEGFWIKIEWLWRNPKPSVIKVLKAWGLL